MASQTNSADHTDKNAHANLDNHPQPQPGAAAEAIAGLLGGLFSATCTQPLDVIKTRMQIPGAKYKTTWDGLKYIIAEEGVKGLYVGLASEYTKTAVQNFTYFYWYSWLKSHYFVVSQLLSSHSMWSIKPSVVMDTQVHSKKVGDKSDEHQIGVLPNLVIGCLAGAATQLVVNPLTVVQTRIMTSRSSEQAGLFKTFAHIWSTEGPHALFNGIIPSLVLTLNPAIQFLVFDRLKSWWQDRLRRQTPPRENLSAVELLIMGSIAKIVATIITYPYILGKTRLQWKGDAKSPRYSNTLDVLRQAIAQDGFFGLYVGLKAQILKSVVGAATLFMAKEKIIEFAFKLVRLIYGPPHFPLAPTSAVHWKRLTERHRLHLHEY